ncbi:glycosyl transferase family 2 [Paenibacillus curdlanolyticus YK9]|uniref:Glycosyl transferase family 2 n=1 Tax=Paenibacillus curdlanolyticus YK9 TaxID=717606 RepID=E0IFJ0_9BACL|nr:glycosyltransferase family 2 protein [Paenibacillus curdlanolyticus]EFM08966.1 glycosyl transferase family 2 [Paenibacillus curdlanolyticus YK9]
MTKPMTSIIVPTYNGLGLLQRLVQSIREHTNAAETPYELIIVDNGSQDGTAQWCINERLTFLSLGSNEGFPAACNKGLRLAAGDRLMLLNNDIVATPNWLANLSEGLVQEPGIGLVGPVTNYASGIQQVDYPFETLEQFVNIAREVNKPSRLKRERVMRLVGLCLLFTREVYERVGDLDERFSPGHYEDDDLCLRIRMHGYGLLLCRDALVYHEGSASFRHTDQDALSQLLAANRQKFIDKWGIDPNTFVSG